MRLIDADMLQKQIQDAQISLESNNDAVWEMNKNYFKGLAWAHRLVIDAPTVDVVEVVRCMDCVNWQRHTDINKAYGPCKRYGITKHESGFCNMGKRKGGGNYFYDND